MNNFDDRGKVSLWRTKSDNPKAPVASGKVIAHRNIREGEELDISLWKNTSENPKAPVMRGEIKDKWEPQGKPQAAPPPSDPTPFDDEIPW